jgi:hypothetical protein
MTMNLAHARLAAHAWDYALSLCIRTLPKGSEREALLAAEERPTIANIRAVLILGRGSQWLNLIESALIEMGLAAIDDILKEADDGHHD